MNEKDYLNPHSLPGAIGMVNPYAKANKRTTEYKPTAEEAQELISKMKNQLAGSVRYDDPVNHPSHYTSHPSGIECITITECMNFNVGNAIKYLWRAGLKKPGLHSTTGVGMEHVSVEQHLQDLRKAQWYINREIERVSHGSDV